ncbi:nucleotidyltransferase family protein [Magnetococcales bacterium HHB-1]
MSFNLSLQEFGHYPDPLEENILRAILLNAPLLKQTIQELNDCHHHKKLSWDLRALILSLQAHEQFNQLAPTLQQQIGQFQQKTKKRLTFLKLRLHATCKILTRENIDILIIKGMALAPDYYPDIYHRPMTDIDLVVQQKDIDRAIDLLTAKNVRKWEMMPCNYRSQHAITMLSSDGFSIDVHPFVLYSSLWPGADTLFWQNRVDYSFIPEQGIYSLNSTDHLIQIILHGFRRDKRTPIRWIVDTGYILKFADIDWDYLYHQACDHDCTSILLIGLTYLKERMEQDIPESVLQRLQKTPSRKSTLRYFQFMGRLNATVPPTPYWRLVYNWYIWRRLYWRERQETGKGRSFLTYLLNKWNIEHLWQLPQEINKRWNKEKLE